MTRTTTRLLAAAVSTATALVLGTGTAQATIVDPAQTGIDLWTSATFDGVFLTITADGEFRTLNEANTTLLLEVVGTETWVDLDGHTHVAPLTASPVSVVFGRTNHVEAVFELQSDSTVEVTYTAQHVGLTPSPFTGSCSGAALRTDSSSPLTTKDC
jgi:hypothetical protein